ncbi:cupin [Mycolicibacterium porcinum]|uniref:cupin domain-containing protein n=1 Tax=Mycolicibacterium porcinum TaxID=39693 RepID=UPI00080B3378|nr:cupin domain-containing protein [Mycolicibacterium porcinum]OCB09110.1 cupin [Mycolicibacterium porcinum]
MNQLNTTEIVRLPELVLAHEPVPAEQVAGGQPHTGSATVGEFGEITLGVWEMTAGAMRDIEVDEVFVVLSGSATVDFTDGTPTLELRAGDTARLTKGAHTTWTVTETLRKVSITPASSHAGGN